MAPTILVPLLVATITPKENFAEFAVDLLSAIMVVGFTLPAARCVIAVFAVIAHRLIMRFRSGKG